MGALCRWAERALRIERDAFARFGSSESSGILTAEEFEAKKTALLDRLSWRLVLIGLCGGARPAGASWLLPRAAVNGHRFLPTDGHPFSPPVAMSSPRWWPSLLPSALSTQS